MISKCPVKKEFASMSIRDRAIAAMPVIEIFKKEFKTPNPPRAMLKDQLYSVLQESGLAKTDVLFHTDNIGTFPRNRSGTILDVPNVEKQVHSLYSSGLSLTEMSRCAAVCRPEGQKGDRWEELCRNLSTVSAGKLAHVSEDSLKCFTIAGGHGKEALRCINHETVSDNAEISTDGRVNKSKFSHRGPTFVEALDTGIHLLLIDPIVDHFWPSLLDDLMEADNVVNQVANDDNDIALLWKISRIANALKLDDDWADMKREKTIVDSFWQSVLARVQSVEMRRKDNVPHFVDFVRHCGGGFEKPVGLIFLN